MFENQLWDFYKTCVTSRGLVFKHLKKTIFYFILIQILFGSALYYVIPQNKIETFSISCLVFEFEAFSVFYLFVIKRANAYAFEKYHIKFKGKEWDLFRHLILKNFLIKKRMLNKDKNKSKNEVALTFFINVFQKRLENKKTSSFSTAFATHSGILVAYIIPVWAAFNNWMYKDKSIPFKDGVIYFFTMFIIIIAIIVMWVIFKVYFIGDFFQFEVQQLSNLIEMLEGIQFSFNNSHYLKQLESSDMNKVVARIINEYELSNSERVVEIISQKN